MNGPSLFGLLTALFFLGFISSSRAAALVGLYPVSMDSDETADAADTVTVDDDEIDREDDDDLDSVMNSDRIGEVLQELRASALRWLRSSPEEQQWSTSEDGKPTPKKIQWPSELDLKSQIIEKRDSPGMTMNTAEILFHALKKPRNSTRLPLRNNRMTLKGLANLFKTGRKR